MSLRLGTNFAFLVQTTFVKEINKKPKLLYIRSPDTGPSPTHLTTPTLRILGKGAEDIH